MGNLEAAKSPGWLAANGITHIVSVSPQPAPTFPPAMFCLHLPVYDSFAALIAAHFDEACEFIGAALDSDGRVLVHCWKGVSRSATIVLAYVMRSQRLQYEAALITVRDRRPCIEPNPGFQTQLVRNYLHGGEDNSWVYN